MSDNLQNNPFAALFSCVKEAQAYTHHHHHHHQTHGATDTQQQQQQEQQEQQQQGNEGMEEEEEEEEGKEGGDENAHITTTFLEELLLITTRPHHPHSATRVFIPSTDTLTLDTLPSLLFDRLLMDTPDMVVVGPFEGGNNAAPQEKMLYLCDCYKRCWKARNDTLGHVAIKVLEVVVTNIATALEQPKLYPGQKINKQMFKVLHEGLCAREPVVEDLTRDVATLIHGEGETVAPKVFGQVLGEVTAEISTSSLMTVNFRLMEVIELYASLPLLAPLLTALPAERNPVGRLYLETPLGRLLCVSSLPHHNSVRSSFFEKPSSKPPHVHKDTEKSIWLAQRNVSVVTYKIFYKLLKVSIKAREGLLTWIDSCLSDNRARAGLWHVQGVDIGSHSIYASDAFMINLGAVMLQLAEPFTQDIKTAKILKVDPTYCKARSRSKSGIDGAYTECLEDLTTLVSQSNATLSYPKEYSFITACFFLTHRTLHLGMQVTQQKITKLSQELGRLHQNENVTDAMRNYIEARTSDLMALKAALFEPHMLESLLQFLGATTEWLVQIALTPADQKSPPTTLREVALPHTHAQEDQDPGHPFLQYIPELLVENLTETISAVRHYTTGLLDATPDKGILSQLMSFIVVFMGSPKRMTNPHLRAQLAGSLEVLIPNAKTSSGGVWKGYQEQLFHTHPLSTHLVSTLLNVFVSIEMTGQNVAFEDKFGYRRPMYEVMKYLWEVPTHRHKFTQLASQALSNMESAKPPLFLRFVNLLINDSIYLLDEGLSYMLQLKEAQSERDAGEWDKLPPGQREARERTLQSMMLMARFHNTLGAHNVQILIRLTKEIPHMFTHSTLVDRMAGMLNYFLSRLVGPKQKELKVRYMEKYEFHPGEMVNDICTVYTHLYSNPSFCLAVSSDGRSYTPHLFSQASDVLCRVGRHYLADEMQRVGEAVVVAGKAKAEDEDIASEAPEEFLDPIMSHLMMDPVILPSSKLTVDRQTIARHLLSDQIDPFNRQPLTMEQVIPNTQLKNRITAWLEEKRAQRAAPEEAPAAEAPAEAPPPQAAQSQNSK